MSNKRSDLIAGVVLALFSGWYYFEATNIRVMKAFAKNAVNSTSMPKIWAICLLLLSLCLIVRGIKANKASDGKESFSLSAFFKNNIEVFATFLALFFYIFLMEPLGFVISSMIYVFVQALILTQVKTKASMIKAGILAVVCSCATYYVFVNWLAVLLPAGAIFE